MKSSNIELYTSFSGTPSRADHLSVSRGKTALSESAHNLESKHSHGSMLSASAVQSTTSKMASRPTRIRSAAISKLVEQITSVNSTTAENLAKLGYSKARLESSRDNLLPRNTSRYNEKLEKASLLLENLSRKQAESLQRCRVSPLANQSVDL